MRDGERGCVFPHREYLSEQHFRSSSSAAPKTAIPPVCVCDLSRLPQPTRASSRIPFIPMIIQLLSVIRAINVWCVCWHTDVPQRKRMNKNHIVSLTPFISRDLLSGSKTDDCKIHFLSLAGAGQGKLQATGVNFIENQADPKLIFLE